jgi:2-polyprenyl-3-methyl-5-hydroxy-6-metoxy-1,4-benzoquinol methylase
VIDDRSADVGRRARALYADESLMNRLHVLGRWRSCPFPALEARVPDDGDILDIGCGFGLFSAYLALSSSGRRVTGIDIDERKIGLARRAAAHADPSHTSLSFEVAGPELPAGPFDAVTIVDVLYLLGPEAGGALLDRAVTRLAPGGVVLLKEIDRHPAWKYRLSRWQEIAATRVFRFTAGDEVSFAPPEVYVDRLRAAGLAVTCHPLDRGSLHPHHLIEARADG